MPCASSATLRRGASLRSVEQAEAHYRQALALAEELGMRPLQAHCHRGLGTLYATTGQREQARTALSTAIEMYQANALRADYGSCSTYSMVSPLHPGHPIVGIPPVYSPRNLAAPMATSMMASLTSISSPQTGQR